MSTVALQSRSGWFDPALSEGAVSGAPAVPQAGPVSAPKPRLLDRVREVVRTRHDSSRTENA
jgi:hypothetical protein